jgi:hypothetical protein
VPVIAPQVVAILAITACAVTLVLLLAVVVLARRLRAVRQAQLRASGPGDRDVVEMLELHRAEVASAREEAANLHAESLDLREQLRGSLSRIAVVRYDAFDDMGGAQSFSAALLDEHGHGMVISAINGRSETRCYAKPIVEGLSEHTLSSEEDAVITAAIEGRPATVPTTSVPANVSVSTPATGSSRGRRRRRAS